ncbi:isoleucine--tRNA ligase [Planktothrix sp. FACHB-1355]|uniref:Isoleucine--tRNA ligase n=1 Tax=Aerosakkonema funiforme FACHB-1375 TaxID=2949571 RepID=A0A926VLD4_9CYAN|nr:isoleucine--tRNA ligase [Aerosakkonema funiforme]MBD2185869.1 isoleucine--tRNA ligase [Aerosakkonema funiforme FACHB-1375]MBD3559101.1 isoleucine--tRNA ligase [Planktothrix sp. FACHB-1355]
MTESKTYKDTVNLPKTQFDMRANAIAREPQLQKFWAEHKIYEKLSQNNPGDIFVLHDGPPYANGSLHMGHALNKILKDIINKYQLLGGRKVRYVPGWDCHGLPIELKVLQDMKAAERQNLTPLELRRKARDFALKTVDEQREGFKRFGVWGDWDNPYLTLKPEYEAAQIGVFGQMLLKGYIYRGLKPVHWSPSSKTALAEAELEYPEDNQGRPTHTSRSIYAAFPMVSLAPPLKSALEQYLPELGVAIWTTTPWTIPGNLAVAVNPNLSYAVVEVSPNSAGEIPGKFKYLIVAADLVERLSSILGVELTVKATGSGKSLETSTYRHPLFDRESPIVIGGDYVTTDSGTGLVHTAPGHGQEDYQVGRRYNLPILAPVDDDGNFTKEAGDFVGLNVLGDGNAAVIKALAEVGSLLKEEPYVHKYPYDWRTKKPTIFRATEQWFASVEGFREEALKAIASVKWIPAQGENRITPMVADRSDWCISRQRSWGVPIPVFYDEETGEPLLTEETIAHVQQIVAEKGSDAWWELSVPELLPPQYRENGRTYRKGTDTMDVWFDSGSSWAAVAKQRPELIYPVDMYLEGSDQHRGWFQSSLLTSVANNDIAPYKTVLTHGFTLDEQGRKMSKSLGNVIDPRVVIEGGKNQKEEPPYGADVLRLWVSSVDYSSDVPISKNILKQLGDVRNKIRNTARFLLGNLHDFDPAKDAVPYDRLPDLDRYMLHRMTEVFAEITEAFESFQFFRFFQTVQNFCVVDLSNFYLDMAKDRLYISAPDSFRRRSCQTVLAIAVENLARAIAPVLCHMAEDIWQFLPYPKPAESVFESGWVKLDERWKNPELAAFWQELRQMRGDVNKVMEQARKESAIGSSLEAKVLLYVEDAELRQRLQDMNPTVELPAEIAAAAELEEEDDDINIPIQVTTKETYSEQWNQFSDRVSAVVSEWVDNLGEVLQDNQKLLTSLGLIVAVVSLLYAIASMLNAVNRIPALEPFFTLVGVIYCLRFASRNLFKAADREVLFDRIQSFKDEVVGRTTPREKAIVQAADSITVTTETLVETLSAISSQDSDLANIQNKGVDELRYLFIASQVELLDSPDALSAVEYKGQFDGVTVGIVKAEGEKCDRCWNYSVYVGKSALHPLLCERCIPALRGEF